jgi:glycerol-3-phosphate O-acyltransferase / dihydroxyacetone phosphate acyltransferase
LDSQHPRLVRSHGTSATYRLMRAILRLGVRLFFRRLRLLNREKLAQPGPTILLVTHPRRLHVALLLVAALDRPVLCLLPADQMGGVFKKLTGWALGIQAFESLAKNHDSLLNHCLGVLANQGVIAVFGEPFAQDGSLRAPVADLSAMLALEAILEGHGQLQPAIYPVHWFLGGGPRGLEPMVYVEGPIQAHHFLPKVGEDAAEASLHLAEAVQKAISTNIFGLVEQEVEHFRRELEDLSREHLQQQWSNRPDWKQKPEELQLSTIASRWVGMQNCTDPARLVELRNSLDAYREARRRFALAQFVVETSGPWHTSSLRLAAAWVETALGFPVALYGLINHLPSLAILRMSGLFKHSPQKEAKVEWLLRIFIVFSFYTLQVFLVHFWWGRAAAGYYTLTLPVSGAYLFRYRWLFRRRSQVLFVKALLPARSARLLRRRQSILSKLDRELELFSQLPGMPYEPSPDPAE